MQVPGRFNSCPVRHVLGEAGIGCPLHGGVSGVGSHPVPASPHARSLRKGTGAFMIKHITYWIEPETDVAFIEKVRQYGLRQLGEATGINPPTIGKWLQGTNGLKEEWYRLIVKRVKPLKCNREMIQVAGSTHAGPYVQRAHRARGSVKKRSFRHPGETKGTPTPCDLS